MSNIFICFIIYEVLLKKQPITIWIINVYRYVLKVRWEITYFCFVSSSSGEIYLDILWFNIFVSILWRHSAISSVSYKLYFHYSSSYTSNFIKLWRNRPSKPHAFHNSSQVMLFLDFYKSYVRVFFSSSNCWLSPNLKY